MHEPHPPSQWTLASIRAQIFSIWGMVAVLALTNVMMLPLLAYPTNRTAFLLFVSGMLAHFFCQFLVSAGLDDIVHRRHPRKKRIQILQCVLIAAIAPSFMTAYIF